MSAGEQVELEGQDTDALSRSSATFESLVRNSPFGIYVVDADFRLILVSQGARKVFQHVQPLLGRDFAEVLRAIWTEPFASEAIGLFRHTLETGEPYHSPRTVELREDIAEVESYDWKIERIFLPDGRQGVVCHFYDLSERLAYEKALRESEAYSAAIFDNLAVGIANVDLDSRFIRVNEAFARQLGYERDELVGRTLNSITHPEDVGIELPHMRAVLSGEAPSASWKKRYLQKDGRPVWVHITVSLMRDASGEPQSYVGVIEDITARRQVEEALRESEERLRLAMEAARLGTWEGDLATQITYYSEAVGPIFGRPREPFSLAYEEWASMVHPDDLGPVIEAFTRLLERDEPYRVNARVVSPSGEVRWLEVHGAAVRDSSGKPVRAIGVISDVTEQRATESAARESAERFSFLAESIPQKIFTATAEGDVDYVNSAWEEYTGLKLEHIRDWGWLDFVHPDDVPENIRVWKDAVATGEPLVTEHRFRRRDGDYRWHLSRARPMKDAAGKVLMWLGSNTDIHEQKVREQTLRFLADLNDVTRELSDPTSILTTVERMLGEHLGVSRCAYAEVEDEDQTFTIVEDWSPALPSSSGTYPQTAFGPRAFTELRAGETLVIRDVDQELTPAEGADTFNSIGIKAIVCCPLIKEGVLTAMMAVHSDRPRNWRADEVDLIETVADRCWSEIERARAERALRASYQDLEERVSLRTSDLLSANERLQGFTYHVSHDLRAPLRAIVSTSRIIQEDFGGSLPSEVNELLARQAEAANKMGQLVDDLLKFSRLARQEFMAQEVDLTALARDATGEAMSTHPYSSVRVEVEEGMVAQADPKLMRLALQNLIENAVKYSPGGGMVRVGQRDGAFFVSDEGIGIDPKYLEKIFEPFQRLHRDEEFKGTGIGLANVRQVMDRHGGRVWAESELGKGSTFYFTLPSP